MNIIKIYRGDSLTITETVSGLTTLTGYSAKLYIQTTAGVDVGNVSGTVDADDLTVTYSVLNESSKSWDVGNYLYETKIWDSSDHVYTLSTGRFIVLKSLENDPS
jgi:hypothetical protein